MSKVFLFILLNLIGGIEITAKVDQSIISRYFCLETSGSFRDENVEKIYKKHFFHEQSRDPLQVSPYLFTNIYCHDALLDGFEDSILFPRLGESNHVFTLFNKNDDAFLDKNFNGESDIEDKIKKDLFGTTGRPGPKDKIFSKIYFQNSPMNHSREVLGHILNPSSEKNYTCPTMQNVTYGSLDYFTLKNLGSVQETEELFALTLAENRKFAKNNVLLASKTEVSGALFYVGSDRYLHEATMSDIENKTLYLFWPIDEHEPLIRKDHQELYKITSAEEANIKIAHDYGSRSIALGCIPSSVKISIQEGFKYGEACQSDLSCNSLVCGLNGKCDSSHYKNRYPGSSCLDATYCRIEYLNEIRVIFERYDHDGKASCHLQSYQVPKSGSCVEFTCLPPKSKVGYNYDPECINSGL